MNPCIIVKVKHPDNRSIRSARVTVYQSDHQVIVEHGAVDMTGKFIPHLTEIIPFDVEPDLSCLYGPNGWDAARLMYLVWPMALIDRPTLAVSGKAVAR